MHIYSNVNYPIIVPAPHQPHGKK